MCIFGCLSTKSRPSLVRTLGHLCSAASLAVVSRPTLDCLLVDSTIPHSALDRLLGNVHMTLGRVSHDYPSASAWPTVSPSVVSRPRLDHHLAIDAWSAATCSAVHRPTLDSHLVVSRPSLGRVSVITRPSRGRVLAITWPSRNHLVVVSRNRLAAVTRLTYVTSGRFCVVFIRLLANHLSDQPHLVGCLSRALSVAFEASLDTDCLCLSLYPAVPNTLQDEVVTKTQPSYQDHKK